jgi:hypothetical protein
MDAEEQRNTYDGASLANVIHQFEEHYGISSVEFHKAHVTNDEAALADMPGSTRQAWAMFYAEWRRMAPSSNFSERAARELAAA